MLSHCVFSCERFSTTTSNKQRDKGTINCTIFHHLLFLDLQFKLSCTISVHAMKNDTTVANFLVIN